MLKRNLSLDDSVEQSQPKTCKSAVSEVVTIVSSDDEEAEETVSKVTAANADNDANECSLCFEEFSSEQKHFIVSLKCGHLFGESCIKAWLNTKEKVCPECRKPAKVKHIRRLYGRVPSNLSRDGDAERKLIADLQVKISSMEISHKSELEREVLRRAKTEEFLRNSMLEASQLAIRLQDCKGELVSSQSEMQQLKEQLYVSVKESLPQSSFLSKLRLCQRIPLGGVNGCRGLAYDKKSLSLIAAAEEKDNIGLFLKGVEESSSIPNLERFLKLHDRLIHDVKVFERDGAVVALTISSDKTLAVVETDFGNVLSRINLGADGISCALDTEDGSHIVYAGMANNTVMRCNYINPKATECFLMSPMMGRPFLRIHSLFHRKTPGKAGKGLVYFANSSGVFLWDADDIINSTYRAYIPDIALTLSHPPTSPSPSNLPVDRWPPYEGSLKRIYESGTYDQVVNMSSEFTETDTFLMVSKRSAVHMVSHSILKFTGSQEKAIIIEIPQQIQQSHVYRPHLKQYVIDGQSKLFACTYEVVDCVSVIYIWDIPADNNTETIHLAAKLFLPGSDDEIRQMVFTDDCRYLLVSTTREFYTYALHFI